MALLLRIGKRTKWVDEAGTPQPASGDNIRRAATDFSLRESESYLSCYSVESVEDAQRLAKLHSQQHSIRPDSCDFILVPDEVVSRISGLSLSPGRDTEEGKAKYGELRSCYQQLNGLTEELSLQLASQILASPTLHVERISRSAVVKDCFERAESDATYEQTLHSRWREELDRERKKAKLKPPI